MKTELMGLDFGLISIRDIIDDPELIEMTVLHWNEIAKDKEVMRLNVDRDHYLNGERDGSVFCVAAWDVSKLAGYFIMHMYTHPHYQHVYCAQSDIYYLLPEYRSGVNGFTLLKAGLKVAKERGASYAFVSTKVGHDHPNLMDSLGLKPRDLMYGGPL
jgi:GNAT superfamily N-acetyltransferase